jgi:hypothetical protein
VYSDGVEFFQGERAPFDTDQGATGKTPTGHFFKMRWQGYCVLSEVEGQVLAPN